MVLKTQSCIVVEIVLKSYSFIFHIEEGNGVVVDIMSKTQSCSCDDQSSVFVQIKYLLGTLFSIEIFSFVACVSVFLLVM